MASMQSWDERQLELLRPQYPEWDIWTVRSIHQALYDLVRPAEGPPGGHGQHGFP
jgi:hypothetical protein